MVAITEGRGESAKKLEAKFQLPFLCIAEGAGGAFASYKVRVTPFGFVIGEDGHVLSKGLCNSAERLRDLLEMGGLSAHAGRVDGDNRSSPRPTDATGRQDSTAKGTDDAYTGEVVR